MNKLPPTFRLPLRVALTLACLFSGQNAWAVEQTVFLEPSKDTSIFEGLDASSGQGVLFTGRVGSKSNETRRRALMAFDVVNQLPPDAVILRATLHLSVSSVRLPKAKPTTIHRMLADWGEGSSHAINGQGDTPTAGDATWTTRVVGSDPLELWANPGGDFVPEASGETVVALEDVYPIQSTQVARDVQDWVDGVVPEYGWMIRGDESTTVTSAHLYSRESSVSRSQLEITYRTPSSPSRREAWLTEFLESPDEIDDLADLDFDGVSNLLEYAHGRDPSNRESPDTHPIIETLNPGEFAFSRDPRTDDLTYEIFVSDDLMNWDSLLRSENGKIPVASAGGVFSEMEDPERAPFRQVTLTDPARRAFARLEITRE